MKSDKERGRIKRELVVIHRGGEEKKGKEEKKRKDGEKVFQVFHQAMGTGAATVNGRGR